VRVDVYFNLHRRLFSVRALEGENKGRVIDHVAKCAIRDARFVVSEAGRQRVIHEGVKNVHAYIRGERIEDAGEFIKTVVPLSGDGGALRKVSYDPHLDRTFIDRTTLEPMQSVDVCVMMVDEHRRPIVLAV